MLRDRPKPVAFVTNERSDDLIVSFAVDADVPGDVLSVILMRTPKFEHLLDVSERGVRVSHERFPDADDDYLRRLVLRDGLVEINSTRRTYLLDVSRVNSADLEEAERIAREMNVDHAFELIVK